MNADSSGVIGTAGNVGTNPATVRQSFAQGLTPGSSIMEDGSSSGGTINVTAQANPSDFEWIILAVAFAPSATPSSNSIFYNTD